ncbi:MAG: hypothetical protein GY765_00280, partial [bacterium]|nr:hypothetical protein [bacterium]
TLKAISRYVKEWNKEQYRTVEPVEKKEYYPLSSAQKRMYVLHGMTERSISYNLPSAAKIKGNVDAGKLHEAFETLIRRHESLRTSFELQDDNPVQKVHNWERLEFTIRQYEVDVGSGEGNNPLHEMRQTFIRPFDLAVPPLLRVGLVKNGQADPILMLDMHHIIADGHSMQIIV